MDKDKDAEPDEQDAQGAILSSEVVFGAREELACR